MSNSHDARASAAKAQTQQSLSYIRIFVYEIHMNPIFMLLGADQRAEVVGVYTLALLTCMVVGYVPEEMSALARLLNVNEKVIHRAWPLLSDLFVPERGKLIHPRIQSERIEILRISETRKQVARKRWNRGFEDASPSLGAKAQQLELEREEYGNRDTETTDAIRSSLRSRAKHSMEENAIPLVEVWNRMAAKTAGALSEASLGDLPHEGLRECVERLGGLQKVSEAIDRLGSLPFYQGEGPNGWKASLPWLLQRKNLASLLAQTPLQKVASAADSADISETDRALLDQLRESAVTPQGRI